MRSRYYENYRKSLDPKLIDLFNEHRMYCHRCGHTVVMLNVKKKLCSWCGHWVFQDKRDEMKFRIKEQQNKLRREENK